MRRSLIVMTTAGAVVAAGGATWAIAGGDSAGDIAAAYLAAWQRQDYRAMSDLVGDPPPDFAARHRNVLTDLKVDAATYRLGEVRENEARFTVTLDVPRFGRWRYRGVLPLERSGLGWQVAWRPSVIHPERKEGDRLRVKVRRGEKAPILAADGGRIDTADAPGSVQQVVDELRKTYKSRLTGGENARIERVPADDPPTVIAKKAADPGKSVKTTLDPRVHRAAAKALDPVDEPASLVALRPSDGAILAVANKPGGYNRALMGQYAPGSTFKVVTASAMVAGGMSPGTRVKCPARQTIGGFEFHNAGYKEFGTLSLRDAFAHSCNTTFADHGVRRLGAGRLTEVAESFGFNAPLPIGVPAARAEFPRPKGDTDLAAASFGQGRVLTSPLNMAAVAAAIRNGTWRPPRLVPETLLRDRPAPRGLEKPVVRALRKLMPAVVTEGGTAGGVDFPQGVAGKTGTAEYGTGKKLGEHSWFIGYRGDLAFAVLAEGAGEGAAVAAPAAARFLRELS